MIREGMVGEGAIWAEVMIWEEGTFSHGIEEGLMCF